MERINDIEDVAALNWLGEYNSTDLTLLTIARVLNTQRLICDALLGPAMLTAESMEAAVEEATSKVPDPSRPFTAPSYLEAIRRQAAEWLKDHGTTLTTLKRDYNNATYRNHYMLGMRTITYYKVPHILADLIARTGNYEQRDLMEA